jgi:O-antigen ligase
MLPSENSIAGKIAFVFLCLFAFGLAFSISIAQTGLGLVFLIFIATIATQRGRAALSFAGAPRLKILYISLLAWTVWRIFHIAISPVPVAELIEAREVWLMLIPLFIYFYASSRRRLWIVTGFFIAGVAVSSAYGAWQMRADFWNMVRGRGLSGMHHLNFAGMAALATVLGAGLTWAYYYSGKKSKAVLVFVLTFMAAVGLWLTKSRGAIATTALVFPLFIYVQLYNKIQRVVFVAAVLIVGALVVLRIPDTMAQEFKMPPPEVHGGSQAERRDLWQAGAQMIKDRPLTGWGERGYNLAYGRYQVPGAVGVAAYDTKWNEASHMHNDFINTCVLYGLVGLLLQLFYYFFGGFIYLRERFRIRRDSDRPLAAAAATCLPLMAFMGMTQCHFTSEIVQMSFWLAVGVLFSVLESDRAGTT